MSENPLLLLGHIGISGYELADPEAKAVAAATSHPPRSMVYASTKFFIRRTLTYGPPANVRTAEAYGGFPW